MALVSQSEHPRVQAIPRAPRPMRGSEARAAARRARGPVNVTVFIPLTLLLILGAPLVLIMLPVINAVVIARGLDPRMVSAALGALPALRGLDVDVQTAEAVVRVKLF